MWWGVACKGGKWCRCGGDWHIRVGMMEMWWGLAYKGGKWCRCGGEWHVRVGMM